MAKKVSKRLAARNCDFCEKEFQPVKKWQRFCSIPCHGKYWTAARVHPDQRFVTLNKRLDSIESEMKKIIRLSALEK